MARRENNHLGADEMRVTIGQVAQAMMTVNAVPTRTVFAVPGRTKAKALKWFRISQRPWWPSPTW
jgi:hypothetical protein